MFGSAQPAAQPSSTPFGFSASGASGTSSLGSRPGADAGSSALLATGCKIIDMTKLNNILMDHSVSYKADKDDDALAVLNPLAARGAGKIIKPHFKEHPLSIAALASSISPSFTRRGSMDAIYSSVRSLFRSSLLRSRLHSEDPGHVTGERCSVAAHLDTPQRLLASSTGRESFTCMAPLCTAFKTRPTMDDLSTMDLAQLRAVQSFRIWNEHGAIEWPGTVDISYVNVDACISLTSRAVVLNNDYLKNLATWHMERKLSGCCIAVFYDIRQEGESFDDAFKAFSRYCSDRQYIIDSISSDGYCRIRVRNLLV